MSSVSFPAITKLRDDRNAAWAAARIWAGVFPVNPLLFSSGVFALDELALADTQATNRTVMAVAMATRERLDLKLVEVMMPAP